MKVVLMSREYPPEVYGGAGVHVAYLAAELARSLPVEVRCFGAQRPEAGPGQPVVRAFGDPTAGPGAPSRCLPWQDATCCNRIWKRQRGEWIVDRPD